MAARQAGRASKQAAQVPHDPQWATEAGRDSFPATIIMAGGGEQNVRGRGFDLGAKEGRGVFFNEV